MNQQQKVKWELAPIWISTLLSEKYINLVSMFHHASDD